MRRSVLELDCAGLCSVSTAGQPFWRELFKTIEPEAFRQDLILVPVDFLRRLDPYLAGRVGENSPRQGRHRAAQNLNHPPTRRAPKPLRLAGNFSPGLAMVCSLWDSLQGSKQGSWGSAAAHSTDPANQLPHSTHRQATRPPGSSTAHFQLSKSSTGHSVLQLARNFKLSSCLRLIQDTGPRRVRQALPCGKT